MKHCQYHADSGYEACTGLHREGAEFIGNLLTHKCTQLCIKWPLKWKERGRILLCTVNICCTILLICIYSKFTFLLHDAMHSAVLGFCPSICPSHSCIVSKWLKISSNFLLGQVTHDSNSFEPECRYQISREMPSGGIKYILRVEKKLKGSVKEPNMFHNYESEKITRKASDVAENLQLYQVVQFFCQDRHAGHI